MKVAIIGDEERQNALGDGMTHGGNSHVFWDGSLRTDSRSSVIDLKAIGTKYLKKQAGAGPSKAKQGASLRYLLLTRKMPACLP